MKDMLVLLIMQLPAGILCGGAVWLANQGKEGWGWMLFVAVLVAATREKAD